MHGLLESLEADALFFGIIPQGLSPMHPRKWRDGSATSVGLCRLQVHGYHSMRPRVLAFVQEPRPQVRRRPRRLRGVAVHCDADPRKITGRHYGVTYDSTNAADKVIRERDLLFFWGTADGAYILSRCLRSAMATASARLAAPIFWKSLIVCSRTTVGVMPSWAPISALESPRTIDSRISV